jgi:hypothetical protein
VGQAIRLDLHRRKSVPEKGRAKKRPSFVNFRSVAAQELSDGRGDAGDMNMQLVLAAASCRINRHSNLVTRQLTARPFLDETAGVPCCLPIVWRIFPQQRRAFDAGNKSGRDNDDMRSARRRPEHGKASLKTIGDVDLGTRKHHADALVGWHTDVVDDGPQPIPVGGRGRFAIVARISPMAPAKLTLRKTNPSETLLIAGLMRTLSNDLGALTFGVFVKLERSS